MTRIPKPRVFLFTTLFLTLPAGADAQVHQHEHADTTRTTPMDHGGMMDMEHMHSMIPQMMEMHERMMADSVIHQGMIADAEMRALMAEMMGTERDMEAMHERMAEMSPEDRRAMTAEMHERMMARMDEMLPDDRAAMMHRMMEVHRRLMADPAVHDRMMADPEMRRMMQQMMHDDGMMHHGADQEMDHGRMEGMDHGGRGEVQERMEPEPMSANDVLAAEAASRTAERFHAALVAGDRASIEALLLLDAVVLEGGKAESRTEYLGHHFERDAAFLSAVEREPRARRVEVAGEAAWVSSTSLLSGTYEGRTLDVASAELLVLRRDASAPDGWRVAAVHWSSAARE